MAFLVINPYIRRTYHKQHRNENDIVNRFKLNSVLYKIKLKNAEHFLLLNDYVYDWLNNDPHYGRINFLSNIRLHSSGCAVFQRTYMDEDGKYKIETVYPHKLIAEKFLGHTKTTKTSLVGAKSGNKLDCQLHNLEFRSRSIASRKRKSSSKVGYTGVYKEHNKFRAIISHNKKALHLGMFNTAEEAAKAYNSKSKELFGDLGKINIIRQSLSKL